MRIKYKGKLHFFRLSLDDTNREKLSNLKEQDKTHITFYRIRISQILLGPEAVQGETNIIEITAQTLQGLVTTPIVVNSKILIEG